MGEMENGEKLIIGKRCYVGNLAWRTSWQDLKDKFRECGSVVYANVMRTEDGRSKGWGIVEFESPEEALKAVQSMNGVELGGRPMMVREDREDRDVKNYQNESGRGREGAPKGCQVVVHGIPYKYSWKELKDLFNQRAGGAQHADVVIGRDGRSKGWGTVRFESPEEAEKAIEVMNNSDLEGRRLGVKLDKFA